MPTPTSATGPSETWLFEIKQLQQRGNLEGLLLVLGSLSFQVKETEKRKKMVLHALLNKDNARSIETMLSDMKELPNSLDGLQGLFELLRVQVEEMEKKKKVGYSKTRLLEMEKLSVRVQELEKKIKIVLDAISKKDNADGVVSEKESDAGVCIYPALLCIEKLPDSIEGLLGLLGSLSVKVKELVEKKEAVLHAFSKKYNATSVVSEEKSDACPTMEDIIIAFVEEIEKANQYFDFEEYLKEHEHSLVEFGNDAFGVLKYLVYVLKVQEDSKFNKLDFKQILDAVKGNTGFKIFREIEIDWYSLMWPQAGLDGLVDPILSLIYYIREKGHVMDENPLVELSYIINYDVMFYKVNILDRLLYKSLEKNVSIYFLPLDLEEGDIKNELSICGKIVSCIFESSGPGARVKNAHVTFENSVAAKIAPLLVHRKLCRFIYPTTENNEYEPREIKEYHQALTKYEAFRNNLKKMSN